MADRDGRDLAALRALALGLLVMVTAGVVALGFQSLSSTASRREYLNQPSDVTCIGGLDCNRKSLKADVRAADAAERAYDLAVLQLILGAAGIYFVARTLKATRDAVSEANDATAAAQEAIQLERESSERGLRPYVHVDEPYRMYLWEDHDRAVVHSWRFHVRWKNMGQTPAKRGRAGMNWLIEDGEHLSPAFDFPDRDLYGTNVGALGPGQSFQSIAVIPVAEVIAAREAGRRIFLWAWCEYDDGFPKTPRRRTEFHTRILITDDPRSMDCVFRFDIGDRFNGSDDSCEHQPKT